MYAVRAKSGFGKERKQTDSVVCYEILGGAFSVTKSLSSSKPSSLLLTPLWVFILFQRGLAVDRIRMASWRRGPLSSGLLWHDLWLQPHQLIVRLETLFHWVCLTERKNCFVWWLYGKCWQKFCPAYWKTDISNRSSWTTLIYSGSHPLFVHRLSVSTNAFQFWRLNHCQ